MTRNFLCVAVLAVTFAAATVARANSEIDSAAGDTAHAQQATEGQGAHPHHASLLLGVADNGHLNETAFTAGASYRYAISDRFAVGPMLDVASYDSETTILLIAAAFWRPAGNLLLIAGPGVEYIDFKESAHGAHGSESELAIRAGAGYEFHAGKLTVMPAAFADFVDGHTTMVYGVEFGIGF